MTAKKPSPAKNARKATKPEASSSPTFLYILRDPETQAIRYAGKADIPARRLATHIRDSRRRNTPLYCWMRSLASKGMIPAMSVLGSVSRDAWEAAETALIATLRESGADLLNLAAGGNQPRPRACEHLAENGRRTAALIHQGNPRARLIWEKRKEAGTLIAWLESRGDHVRVNRIRSALARLDLAEASCR